MTSRIQRGPYLPNKGLRKTLGFPGRKLLVTLYARRETPAFAFANLKYFSRAPHRTARFPDLQR